MGRVSEPMWLGTFPTRELSLAFLGLYGVEKRHLLAWSSSEQDAYLTSSGRYTITRSNRPVGVDENIGSLASV